MYNSTNIGVCTIVCTYVCEYKYFSIGFVVKDIGRAKQQVKGLNT